MVTRIAGYRSGGSPVAGQRGLPAHPAQNQWSCVPLLFSPQAENASSGFSQAMALTKQEPKSKDRAGALSPEGACFPLDAGALLELRASSQYPAPSLRGEGVAREVLGLQQAQSTLVNMNHESHPSLLSTPKSSLRESERLQMVSLQGRFPTLFPRHLLYYITCPLQETIAGHRCLHPL